MNKQKQINKVNKYLVAAQDCQTREEALEILTKYEEANAKLTAVRLYERLTD